ncbi:hypothetical protein ACFE04_026772 [Oxalis oulophora]
MEPRAPPTPNSYQCKCAPGFAGKTCSEDVEECDLRPCKHGTCMNTFGSYALHTPARWAVKCFSSAVVIELLCLTLDTLSGGGFLVNLLNWWLAHPRKCGRAWEFE